MTRTNIVIAAGLVLAVTLPAVSAQAQSPRTFVSAAGNDSNPCSFAAPCRHFQAAVNATSLGGEVDALDPAGYGPITISQAITIEGQGWSYISPPAGGNGITINAASGDVSIHGVSLNGAGIAGSTNGIVFNSGASLTIENCVVRNHTNNGIVFGPNASSNLVMSDTFVANNKGGNGIAVVPSGTGTVTANFHRVEADNNGDGILVDATSYSGTALSVTAAESVVARNSGIGIRLNCLGNIMVFHSVIANNQTDISVESACLESPTLWIGESAVTENSNGWETIGSGVVLSYGDNKIDGNASSEGAPPKIGNK